MARNIPVHATLPDSVVSTVEEVQEHRANVARGTPIPSLEEGSSVSDDIGAVVILLPGPTATIDGDGQDDESDEHDTGTERTTNLGVVEKGTNNGGSADLSEPVQETVQGTSTGVKVGGVDGVLLIGVEPVGRPHHGEQQNDVWLGNDTSVQTLEFGPPAGVLHENDLCTIGSNDLVGVDEEKRQESTGDHQNDESNVGTVSVEVVRPMLLWPTTW